MAFSRQVAAVRPQDEVATGNGSNGVRREPTWRDRMLDRSLGPARSRSEQQAFALLEAARDLIAEHGSPQFTVRQVLERSGLAAKTFYRHFGSKDDLLLAVMEEDLNKGALILASMVDEHTDPRSRLRAYVTGLVGFLSVDVARPYMSVMAHEQLRLAGRDPEAVRRVTSPLIDLLERELEAAAAAGVVRPESIPLDTLTVFHLVVSQIQALLLGQIGGDAVELGEYTWAFVESALAR